MVVFSPPLSSETRQRGMMDTRVNDGYIFFFLLPHTHFSSHTGHPCPLLYPEFIFEALRVGACAWCVLSDLFRPACFATSPQHERFNTRACQALIIPQIRDVMYVMKESENVEGGGESITFFFYKLSIAASGCK